MSSAGSNPFGDLPDPPRSFPTGPWPGEIVKAELAEVGPPDPGERISILYLMIWTAGSAVILAFYRQAMSQAAAHESPLNPPWLQTISALVMSPLQGAGVASVGLMMWRRVRGGRPFPRQPGHWLLVITGLMALLNWSVYLITNQLFQSGRSAYLIFNRVPLMFAFCALAVYAMTRMPEERHWRKMFLIWVLANTAILLGLCCLGGGISPATWSTYRWNQVLEMTLAAALPVAFLVTGILDRASGAKRDHLHWAGVACRVALIGQVGISMVRMFLPVT
jgi:hypothetical protein